MGKIAEEFRVVCSDVISELRKPPGYPLPHSIVDFAEASDYKPLLKECDLAAMMYDFLSERAEGQPDYNGKCIREAEITLGYYVHELLCGEPLDSVRPKILNIFGNPF